MVTELKFRNAIVWITTDVVLMRTEEGKLMAGQFVAYFSFKQSEGLFYGEILKDDKRHPILFKNVQDALDYSRAFFNYLNY